MAEQPPLRHNSLGTVLVAGAALSVRREHLARRIWPLRVVDNRLQALQLGFLPFHGDIRYIFEFVVS